ncbi:MAG: alpha/beta fold hydrolase [Acidimicrobiia bacterium]
MTNLEGVPVAMVHGWSGSFAGTWQEPGWEALFQDMGRTVVGIDLLGHGSAPKPHDVESYVDLTTRITEAIPEGPMDAIGFSLGSMTLLQLACNEPQRFRRLIVSGIGKTLLDRADGIVDEEAAVRAARLPDVVEHGANEESTAHERSFANYARDRGNDPIALAQCLRAQREPITRERLKALTFPVLVVIGDNDEAGPGEPLAEAMPNAKVVTLRNTDHFATPNNFKFIDAALDFLNAG